MGNIRRTAVVVAVGAALLAGVGAARDGWAQGTAPTIIRLDLSGVVDPFEADYIEGGIEAANAQGAAAVLLVIDTPGGLDSSMRQIVKAVLASDVPVVCYVGPQGARAASAGTFILLSCPVAAMAPATNVGAAHPVGISGAIASDKAVNDAAEFIVSIAERHGRDAEWAERAVRNSISASAEEALDLGVIDLIAPDVPSLLADVHGMSVDVAEGTTRIDVTGATIEPRSLGAGGAFLHALLNPNFAFIFFWLGLAFIAVEFFIPGGVVGTLGAIMLVLSFVAFGMLPVQLVGVALLIASVVFFVLELKHPGVGVPMVGGIAALVLGGFFLFDRAVPGAQVSPLVIAPVAVFAAGFFTIVLRAAMRLRGKAVTTRTQSMIGREGVVIRALTPTGVVQVASEEWTAESVAGPVEKGAAVRVVRMEGLRLEVEPVATVQEPAPAGQGEGRQT